eukprot:4368265-Pyramimonas_sp.AAC.1
MTSWLRGHSSRVCHGGRSGPGMRTNWRDWPASPMQASRTCAWRWKSWTLAGNLLESGTDSS